MTTPLTLLKGTLDVLILKTLSREPLHGYGISRIIAQQTSDLFKVEEGVLYPALRRLEERGLIVGEWALTDTGREARFYSLTDEGSEQLRREMRTWRKYVRTMSQVLDARPARP